MKDERTKRLRQAITQTAPAALEDRRAEAGRTTLSFRSVTHPERHIWIDTDLDGRLEIDLEDWTNETTWDNALVHLTAPDENVPGIVQAWLSGASVRDCIPLGGRTQLYNLDDTVNLITACLRPADKERLQGLNNEEELLTETIRGHHELGRWIRNVCGLWSNKDLLRSITDSHIEDIKRRLSEDTTLPLEDKNSLEIRLGYFARCRRDDFFHPDDFSGIVLRAVWQSLKANDLKAQE